MTATTTGLDTQRITVTPLTTAVGAEISGVDLCQPVSDSLVEQVQEAYLAHGVIFFRDQAITDEQHRDFAARFGKLQVFPFAPQIEGVPEVHKMESDGSAPREPAKSADTWHSDATYMENPPMGSMLRSLVLPKVGGDTLWASSYAAYEGLSSHMQRMLEGMTAVHDATKATGGANREKIWEKFPPREHPVITEHPVTGRKVLFVNRLYTTKLVGVSERENEQLLALLTDHIQSPDFQVRFHWEVNSIAFWDNRCTQHYAVADYQGERKHRRVIIEAPHD